MSRLGLGLGLTKGGVIPFNPLSLDPYLLFDTQSSMIGTFENPTLDLDPSVPSTLDVITATRAGVATYTDADGLIQSATPNTTRVDYTQGAELTPTKFQHVVQTDYSASPNTIGPRVTLSDISGPDGESGGVRVTETANNTQHYLAVKNKEIVSGTTYTVSFYVKEGAYSSVVFYTESSKMESNVSMNFSTGNATFGGPDLVSNSGSFTSVGDGWYRVVYSATAQSSGEMDLYVSPKDLSSYAGDVNNFTDYYGFQVEEGTTASSFVANTTGSPKFLSSAVYSDRVPMVLIEPSAENFVDYSEDFSQWTSENATVSLNVIESPAGTQDGCKMIASTSVERQGIHSVQGQSGDLSFSVYAKKGEYDVIQMTDAINGSLYVNFNLTSGTVGSYNGVTSKIENVGNGWFRCSLTWNTVPINKMRLTIARTDDESRLETFAGNGTDGLYLWGAQLETGSVSTSYIPTSGGDAAARTRAADDLEITGSDFSDFYNASEGTVYVEANVLDNDLITSPHIFEISDGTEDNRIKMHISSSNDFIFRPQISGSNVFSRELGSVGYGSLDRIALSYETNNYVSSLNGSSDVTDTGAVPSNQTQLVIGGSVQSDPRNITGRIRRLLFWPYHSDRL